MPTTVPAQEAPGDVEEFAVRVDPDNLSLVDLVNDVQPVVASIAPVEDAVTYGGLANVLQILGVGPVATKRYTCSIKQHDPVNVMEPYGRGRICKLANGMRDMNIVGLDALDLRSNRPDGAPWDFKINERREYAEQLVRDKTPRRRVGCPPCVAWSTLNQGLNYEWMDPAKGAQYMQEGRMQLAFACRLYLIHLEAGRFFFCFARTPRWSNTLAGALHQNDFQQT